MSQCLLGERVRYDGVIKYIPELADFLRQSFNIIAVCPEVEIGLSTPRPPVQLSGQPGKLLISGRDDPTIDITLAMQAYCETRSLQLGSIHGYVFKSKSPSCGIQDIPIYNQHTQQPSGQVSMGLFAQAISQLYPRLPIADELILNNTGQYQLFLQQVKNYREKV